MKNYRYLFALMVIMNGEKATCGLLYLCVVVCTQNRVLLMKAHRCEYANYSLSLKSWDRWKYLAQNSFEFGKKRKWIECSKWFFICSETENGFGFGCNSHMKMLHFFFFQTLTQIAFIRLTHSNTMEIVKILCFICWNYVGFISADQTANDQMTFSTYKT